MLVFFYQLSAAKQAVSLLASFNKTLALAGFLLIVFYLFFTALAKRFQILSVGLPIARKIGFSGIVLGIMHSVFTLKVLTKTFNAEWLAQNFVSVFFAGAAIFILLFSFLGFTSFFSKKLGNKKLFFTQTLGYIGLFFLSLHILFLINTPQSYYDISKSFLGYIRQEELVFIIAAFITIIFLRIFTIFLDKKGISLQLKIMVHTLIYFSMIVLVFGTYLEVSYMKNLYEKLHKNSWQTLEIIQKSLEESGLEKTHALTDSISKATNSENIIFFLDEERNIVYDSEAKEEGRKYDFINENYLAKDGNSYIADYKRTSDRYYDIAAPIKDMKGYLVISTKYSKSNSEIYQAVSSYGLVATITFLMAIFTLAFTRKNIIGPVKKLTKASQKIAEGDFGAKVEIEGNDEFAMLSRTYNNMTNQIHGQIRELKDLDRLKDEFIAIVSHNLRTPLTALRGYIEFLGYEKIGKLNQKQKHILDKAQDSTNVLLNLSESLLSVTALEGGKVKIEKKDLDVVSLLLQILKELDFKIKDKKLVLENKLGDEKALILGDGIKLKQAFVSIIENAIKFSKEGDKITISKLVEKTEKKVVFVIKDTGIGISKNKQKDAFKKFNRATGIYAYSYEGMGLGLHLTRLIVLAHEGSIWLESEEDKGTSVFISLPLKEGQTQ